MTRRRNIVVAGSLAQRPGNGGHTWVLLQYVLGFRRLGYDVLFLDRLDASMANGADASPNVGYLEDVMRRFGLEHAWSLFCDGGRTVLGRDRHDVLQCVAESDLLLNVMGFFDDAEVLAKAPVKAFLDIDPGFGQMWRELQLHDLFVGHDAYVTIGERIGNSDCDIPTCGIDWITTKQPVVLEHWPVVRDHAGAFTAISTWRGPFGPVEYNGRTYGLRAHEFRKFAPLPKLAPEQTFELALDIHPSETKDISLLRDNDWRLIDPKVIAGTPEAYQRYIRRSMAELMIAKNMYVQTRGGWFSDRSICYLASGKPVLAQDTGLADVIEVGKGLFPFTTLEEAVAGARQIAADYDVHSKAARGLAEAHFDSDIVLARLLSKLGVPA
jgi:hypothetical protein